MAQSHRPFKFFQPARTNCGRGYSGKALVGLTSTAQRVISGAVAGCQATGSAPATAAETAARTIEMARQIFFMRGSILFPQKLRHRLRAAAHMQLFVNAADVVPHRMNAHA